MMKLFTVMRWQYNVGLGLQVSKYLQHLIYLPTSVDIIIISRSIVIMLPPLGGALSNNAV